MNKSSIIIALLLVSCLQLGSGYETSKGLRGISTTESKSGKELWEEGWRRNTINDPKLYSPEFYKCLKVRECEGWACTGVYKFNLCKEKFPPYDPPSGEDYPYIKKTKTSDISTTDIGPAPYEECVENCEKKVKNWSDRLGKKYMKCISSCDFMDTPFVLNLKNKTGKELWEEGWRRKSSNDRRLYSPEFYKCAEEIPCDGWGCTAVYNTCVKKFPPFTPPSGEDYPYIKKTKTSDI